MRFTALVIDRPQLDTRGLGALVQDLGGVVHYFPFADLGDIAQHRQRITGEHQWLFQQADVLLVPFHQDDQACISLVRHIRREPMLQSVGLMAVCFDRRLATSLDALVSGFDTVVSAPILLDQERQAAALGIASLARCAKLDRRTAQLAQLSARTQLKQDFPIPRSVGWKRLRLAVHGQARHFDQLSPHRGMFDTLELFDQDPTRYAGSANALILGDSPPAPGTAPQNAGPGPATSVVRKRQPAKLALAFSSISTANFDTLLHIAEQHETLADLFPEHIDLLTAKFQAVMARQSWRRQCFAGLADTLDVALTDPLTQLFNRKHLDFALPQLMQEARTRGQDLGLVAMDMNGFKLVNDRYGHPVGDVLIRTLGGVIRDAVRKNDFAVRLGGDEFLVVMPTATAGALNAIQERLKNAVQGTSIVAPDGRHVSAGVSIGGILFDARDWRMTPGLLLAKVDHALYAAKQSHYGAADSEKNPSRQHQI